MHSIFLKESQHKMSSCIIMLDTFLFLILPDIKLIFSLVICVFTFIGHSFIKLHFLQISKILTLYLSCAFLYTILSTSFHFFSIPHFTRHYILSFVEISKFFTYPGFSITFMSSFFSRDYYGVFITLIRPS